MIPILYESTETEFQSNGIGRIPCTSCHVREQRNGIYECEFTVSVSEPIYSEIKEGRIIACIHDDQKDVQPFDIYGRTAPMNGLVKFYAHHISYRLGKIVAKPFTAGSCTETLGKIVANSVNPNPFTFWTDKSVTKNFRLTVPTDVRTILGGSSGSILDVYGKGEYKFDKFDVKLYTNRGVDNNVVIRYGKNLTDIRQDKDASGTYNAIAPYWKSSDGSVVVTIQEGYITNRQDDVIEVKALDCSMYFDTQPTEGQLKARALQYLNGNEPWEITENITVDFVPLWQSPEYQDIAALERVSLCDKVSVIHPVLGIASNKVQVIEVDYDVLLERFRSMELGKARTTFVDTLKDEVAEAVIDQVPSLDTMQQAIEAATDLITGATGGNVIIHQDANGKPYEILIMDHADVAEAVNVWRFNAGGLGHSHDGYSGPYSDIALTADGKINADRILVGVLRAIRIVNGDNTFVVESDGSVTAHAINILGGSINIQTSNESEDVIELSWEDQQAQRQRHLRLSPLNMMLSGYDINNPNVNASISISEGYIFFLYNNKLRAYLGWGTLTFRNDKNPDFIIAAYTNSGVTLNDLTTGALSVNLSTFGLTFYDTDGSTVKAQLYRENLTVHGANGEQYVVSGAGIMVYKPNASYPFIRLLTSGIYVNDDNGFPVFTVSQDPFSGDLAVRSKIPIVPIVGESVNIGSEAAPWQSIIARSIELYGATSVPTPFIDTHYNGSTSDYTGRIIEESAGAFRVYNTISWGSDARLKENITELSEAEKRLLLSLKPRSFKFKGSALKHAGLIAQDVIEAEKEQGIENSVLVRGTGGEVQDPKHPDKTMTDYYAVDYNSLTTLLLAQVQELTKTVEELKGKLAAMEGDLR